MFRPNSLSDAILSADTDIFVPDDLSTAIVSASADIFGADGLFAADLSAMPASDLAMLQAAFVTRPRGQTRQLLRRDAALGVALGGSKEGVSCFGTDLHARASARGRSQQRRRPVVDDVIKSS